MREGAVRPGEIEELILWGVARSSKGDIVGAKQLQYSGLPNELVKLCSILPQLDEMEIPRLMDAYAELSM